MTQPEQTAATELSKEQREDRRQRALDLIEAELRATQDTWLQTPPRLDWAAAIAMDALGDLAAEILVDGTMMRSLTIRDGVATLELAEATEMVRIFAAGMRGVLDGHGASNYVEMEMVDGTNGDAFTVTVRRRERPTPHEFRQRAEAERDRLRAELAQARGAACDCGPVREREWARAVALAEAAGVVFGAPDCTCMPWTRQDGKPRYCGPGDTVDQIGGWEVRPDCPHHAGAQHAGHPQPEAGEPTS